MAVGDDKAVAIVDRFALSRHEDALVDQRVDPVHVEDAADVFFASQAIKGQSELVVAASILAKIAVSSKHA